MKPEPGLAEPGVAAVSGAGEVPGAPEISDVPGLPVLPGFREMALRRMSDERRRLVADRVAAIECCPAEAGLNSSLRLTRR